MQKIIVPVVLLIVGLTGGYFAGKESCPDGLVPDIEAIRAEVLEDIKANFYRMGPPPESGVIDATLAKKLIKDYHDEAKEPYVIMTDKDKKLEGFYIERKPFDDILQDTKLTGISFYMAKHPNMAGKPGNYYTLIYMAATKRKKTAQELAKYSKTTDTIDNSGPAYDYINPCPVECGTGRYEP